MIGALLLGCLLLAAIAQASGGRVVFHPYTEIGPIDMGRMALGQGGLSPEPMWDGRVAEIKALRPKLIRLFVQEYFKLLPRKGSDDFATLDRSVDLIVRTGAKPLMSLDFKPGVLYPKVDQDVVEPNDWSEWERLVTALVEHYRKRGSGIRYWEVANEPDIGEDGGCPYRFTPEKYLSYYQRTARAILKGDPDAKVGGPALAYWKSPILPALLDFCAEGKAPLDFVSWHLYSSNPSDFADTIRGVKALIASRPSLHPETILDEWNMALMAPDDANVAHQPAFVIETIRAFLEEGLDYSCYYQIRDYHVDPEDFAPFMSPHGKAFMASWWNRMPQYDGLFDFQDQVRPAYFAFKLLSRLSGRRLKVESDGAHALAAYDPLYGQRSLMVWNYSPEPTPTTIAFRDLGGPVRVHRVKLDAQTASSDESSRLRFQPETTLTPTDFERQVTLEPYGIELWFFSEL